MNEEINDLKVDPFYGQPVEIIIPFHGEYHKVISLIDNIINTVKNNKFMITVVDDGSTKESNKELAEKFKKLNVRYLYQKQKGFGAAVNLALKNPVENINWVVILHSDVRFNHNSWLSNLGNTMIKLKNQGVKMVSAVTNNPTCDTKELYSNNIDPVSDSVIQKNGYIPMYCVIAHRQLFNKIGLLMECPYAGTETEEFAIRMKKFGYKQAVSGKCWVHHEGRGTLSLYDSNSKVKEILNKTKESVLNNMSCY